MALLKSVKTSYGIDATYWNIFSLTEKYRGESNQIVLHGYFTEDSRRNNMQACSCKNFQFTGDDYIKNATREAIYLALKTKYFADAQDC
jgi:hypothetical protein